jgi:N-methylhydantoinase B
VVTGERQEPKGYEHFFVKEGERYMAECNGGGGYGDPLERDPELVRLDARADFISLEAARDEYGVVLDVNTEQYDVDYGATKELRRELLKKQHGSQ